MNKSKKGISLIVLVVTIVVIIILVATVLYNITDGKIFGVANESVFKNDLRIIEEEFEMFVQTKAAQSVGKFEIESLNAADDGLTYNTKTNEKETNIYDVIPTAKKGYYSEFEIIKGELYYKGDVEQKLIWAKELGIGIIPYEIVDGVLISANSNLLLLDSTGTVRIPYNVTKIGEGVFNNLEGLTRVIIPGSVKEIGANAFSNNTSLQQVIMEDGVEIISNHSFYNCTNLSNVQIPNSMTSIGNSAFALCRNLSNINLPNSLTSLGAQCFDGCNSLTSIILPNSLTTINAEVFSTCSSLETVKLSSSITKINQGAFSSCTKLNNIDTSENTNFIFENNMLYTKGYKKLLAVTGNLTSIRINESTEEIESKSIFNHNIKEIYIPASVTKIGEENALGPYILDKLVVDEGNQYYASYDNDLYDKNFEILYKCNEEGNIKVRDGVKKIIRGTFSGNVTSIEMPESLEVIDGWVTIPWSVSYLYIPKNVNKISSQSLLGLEEIEVSEENETYKSINNKYLLSKDEKTLYFVSKSATDILDFPDSIEYIYNYAFSYCNNLKEVILKDGLKSIGYYGFYVCDNLEKVEIPSSIEKIENNAFSNAKKLTNIIIHKKRGEISGEPWGAVYGTRVITYDE